MQVKTFEVRDCGTFIPVFAMSTRPANEEQRFLLGRAGFGIDPLVIMGPLHGGGASYDPYSWDDARTLHVAHQYITEHFERMEDGEVVCVEFILGERDAPTVSEACNEG